MDEDARYRTSSQYRNWSFTLSTLHALRTQTNALAITRNKASFVRRAAQADAVAAQNPSNENSKDTSTLYTPAVGAPALGTPLHGGSTPAASDGGSTPVQSSTGGVEEIQFLTVEEELKLLRVFGGKVLEIGDHLKLPTDIKATALQFFHRFYLHNSFHTYPPIPILKTCLFLACKSEHYNISLSYFCSELSKTTPSDVIGPEFLLTQSLKFNLDVRHPFRALEGAVMEVMNIVSGGPALPAEHGERMEVDGGEAQDKENRVRSAHGRAREVLKTRALLTDVYFHYTPSQIMLASLFLADPDLVSWYLTLKFPSPPLRSRVADVVKRCAEMMDNMPPMLDMAELKALNKKLKKCQDPEKMDMAKLKKERMEKRNVLDPEEEERKAKKRRAEKERMEKDDPFGASLPMKEALRKEDPFGAPLQK